MTIAQSLLWTELYRPQTIEDIIVPQRVRNIINAPGVIQNMLFCGTQGTGKTTLAKILAKQYDTLFINASLKNNIDTIRTEVDNFCGLRSLNSTGIKLVVLDEADNLSAASQAALRGVIEAYADVARFIFTCNYPDKLLSPIRSRLEEVNFDFVDENEQNEVTKGYIKRLFFIAQSNGMQISKDALIYIFKKSYPDIRSMIARLQSLHKQGLTNIELDDVTKHSSHAYQDLFELICSKPTPAQLYSYLSAYKGKEHHIFAELGKSFIEYCRANEAYEKRLGELAITIHKYGVESKQSIDIFVSLMACVYNLTTILK